MRFSSIFLICLFIFLNSNLYSQTASFNSPDTVCRGQNITIVNTSTGQSTNLWNFCRQSPSSVITGVNIGDPGLASRPASIQIYKDGSNYIGFVSNEETGGSGVRMLNFGTNLLNPAPLVTTLSTFSGQLDGPKGMKFLYEGGNWYGFFVADNWTAGYNYILVRLDFGNSLMNTPTLTNFLTVGGVLNEYLTDLDIAKTAQGFIGFISTTSGRLFRINFGNSITSTPTATNLGILGGAKATYSFNLFQRNGNWYLFMPKDDYSPPSNSYLVNLGFGTSLLNSPTVTNYGNPGSLLNRAYDFLPFVDCESLKGYVLAPGANKIVEFTFPQDITSTTLIGRNIGNIANLSFPPDFSNVLIYNNEKYVFLTNQTSNTISRLKLSSDCSSFGIPSSTQTNPPVFHIDSVGTYKITLVLNENLATEVRVCKEIVVIDSIKKPDAQINVITCFTDSIRLSIANIENNTTYSWIGPNGFTSTKPNVAIKFLGAVQAGQYIVTATGRCGAKKDTVSVVVPSGSIVNLGRDTTICQGLSVTLNASTSGTIVTYLWNTGALSPTISVNQTGTYFVKVISDGCSAYDTIKVTILPPLNAFSIGNDTTYCGSFNKVLSTGNVNTVWSTGAIASQINITQPGTYIATITNICNSKTDTIVIKQNILPAVYINKDTVICDGTVIELSAVTNETKYLWNTGDTTKNININLHGIYWVKVNNDYCIATDTVFISECEGDIWVPNAFTPNNDNINDVFKVFGKNILEYKLIIFNRWGEKLFESNDINNSWNGTYKGETVQVDAYAWVIFYKINLDGRILDKMKKGTVAVLR